MKTLPPLLFSLAAPAALLALLPRSEGEPPAFRPDGAQIQRAVAIAHGRAERAGGRPGRLLLAAGEGR